MTLRTRVFTLGNFSLILIKDREAKCVYLAREPSTGSAPTIGSWLRRLVFTGLPDPQGCSLLLID